MAIAKNIVLKDNFGDDKPFGNAYFKVDSVSGNKRQIRVEIGVYKEKDGKRIENYQIAFVPDLSGNNFIAQAYDAIKQDSRFAGSVDC